MTNKFKISDSYRPGFIMFLKRAIYSADPVQQRNYIDLIALFARCILSDLKIVHTIFSDGYYFKQLDSWSSLFQWRCSDDCRYRCMWTIVDNFERKGWPPPQFHGKVREIKAFG